MHAHPMFLLADVAQCPMGRYILCGPEALVMMKLARRRRRRKKIEKNVKSPKFGVLLCGRVKLFVNSVCW